MRLTAHFDYQAPPEALAELFADPEFHLETARAVGAATPAAEVQGSASGEFTVTSRAVGEASGLPPQVRAIAPRGLEIRLAQVWAPPGRDRSRSATLAGEVVGAPVLLEGTESLEASPSGCRFAAACEVKATVPLLGRAIEEAAAPTVRAYFTAQDAVARERLAR
jgi:hypothetical protein